MKNRMFVVAFVMFFALRTLVSAGQESNLQTEMIFPHIANDGGFTMDFIVHNSLGAYGGKATLACFRADGSEWKILTDKDMNGDGQNDLTPITFNFTSGLQVGGQKVKTVMIKTRPMVADLQVGWCRVDSNVRIQGHSVFHFPGGDTTVQPSPTRQGFTLFAEYSASQGRKIGVGIANPIILTDNSASDAVTNITLELRDDGGNLVTTKTIQLPQNGNIAAFLDDDRFFGEILRSRGEFIGSVLVKSDSFITAMSVGMTIRSDGSYTINNSPPWEYDYVDVSQFSDRLLKLACFFPADVSVDQNCVEGMRLIASRTDIWYRIQMGRSNQGDISPFYFAKEDGKVKVDVVVGQYDSSTYEAQNFEGIRFMELDMEVQYGAWPSVLIAKNHKNATSGSSRFEIAFRQRTQRNLSYGLVGPKDKVFEVSWENFSSTLLYKSDSKEVTAIVQDVAEGLGSWLLKLPFSTLALEFPQYASVVGYVANDNGLGFFVTATDPLLPRPVSNSTVIKTTLDAKQIKRIVADIH